MSESSAQTSVPVKPFPGLTVEQLDSMPLVDVSETGGQVVLLAYDKSNPPQLVRVNPSTVPGVPIADLELRPDGVAAEGDFLPVDGGDGKGKIPATAEGVGAAGRGLTDAASQAAILDAFQNAAWPAASCNCVFEGDSLTAGFGVSAGEDWPSRLMSHPQFSGGKGVKANVATSGNTLAQIVSQYATEVYPLRPTGGARAYLFVWIGANDYGVGGFNPATWLASWNSYCAQARSDGFTVVAFTIMRRGEASVTSAIEVNRGTANTGIRSSANWDVLIEPDRVFLYPFEGRFWNDYAHLNATAYARLARHIGNAIQAFRVGRIEFPNPIESDGIRFQISADIVIAAGASADLNYPLAGARIGTLARAVLTRGDGVLLPAGVIQTQGCTADNQVTIRLYNATAGSVTIPTGSAWSINIE